YALKQSNMAFSSANSINWGRLVPQIVYYVNCYCELIKQEEIAYGEKFNVVVPTGNFGNILAAFYAKQMGIPVGKLICASNKNNVLTDFFKTGTYDRNRDFCPSISPSMDILISSNLERLIYHLSNSDSYTRDAMNALKETGKYTVSKEIKDIMDSEFYAGFCSDEETQEQIKKTYNKYSYLLDTHTAVAAKVYEDYVNKTGDETKTVIASTANPYKFSASVLSAIESEKLTFGDDFDAVEKLFEKTEVNPPKNLTNLRNKPCLHNTIIDKADIISYTKEVLGL
ncbi:MAG: threonine synthase, partial [Oscillospiraceae bacterium]